MKTKINSAGHQQPYIGKGHGDKSGEYTFSNNQSGSIDSCSKEYLLKLLTTKEFIAIRDYTNTSVGKKLNAAIRNNTLSKYGKEMRDSIISAIHKHRLRGEIQVYRGISIELNTYREFVSNYIMNKEIKGSVICSTSRDFNRAFLGSMNQNANRIGIVFDIQLPKCYHALPISEISLNKNEQEILISEPKYTIREIRREIYMV